MRKRMSLKNLVRGLMVLAVGLSIVSCIDDSYDFSKDIDLTIGVNADGLKIKLGNTEKIMLGDLLETDDNLKLDGSNRYYLVESGETGVDFSVDPVKVEVDRALLETKYPVILYKDIVDLIPGGQASVDNLGVTSLEVSDTVVLFCDTIRATSKFSTTIEDIPVEIKEIERIVPEDGTELDIHIELVQDGLEFGFGIIEKLSIHMPDFLELTAAEGSRLEENTFIVENFDARGAKDILVGHAVIHAAVPENGVIDNQNTLSLEDEISMEASAEFIVPQAFNVDLTNKNVHADVLVTLAIGDKASNYQFISIKEVTGKYDPEIDLDVEDIDIASNLPDFLQGDDIQITVKNPTIKFDADMTNLPLPLDFSAELEAYKDGMKGATANLPNKNVVRFEQGKRNIVYFSELGEPYSPAPIEQGAVECQSEGLDELIKNVPDCIKVNLDDKVYVPSDESFTIRLGEEYDTKVNYDIYVPFEFNSGLKIAYTDSICDISEDLEDEEILIEGGAKVTAMVVNTIPLELKATLVPYDKNGKEMNNVKISTIKIQPGTLSDPKESPMVITIDMMDDPTALQRIDRFDFKVDAASEAQGGELLSTQYLQVKDMRLELMGKIIYDANDK